MIQFNTRELEALSKALTESQSEIIREGEVALSQSLTVVQREAVKITEEGYIYPDGIFQTGTLRRSINFQRLGRMKGQVFTGKGLGYPVIVERRKPYMSLAVSRTEGEIEGVFEQALKRALRKIL